MGFMMFVKLPSLTEVVPFTGSESEYNEEKEQGVTFHRAPLRQSAAKGNSDCTLR